MVYTAGKMTITITRTSNNGKRNTFRMPRPYHKMPKKQDTLRPTFVTKTHQTHNASIAVTNVSRDGCSLGVPVSSNRKTTTSSSVLSGSDVARPSWFRRNNGLGFSVDPTDVHWQSRRRRYRCTCSTDS